MILKWKVNEEKGILRSSDKGISSGFFNQWFVKL
jgi:hypothetical protein